MNFSLKLGPKGAESLGNMIQGWSGCCTGKAKWSFTIPEPRCTRPCKTQKQNPVVKTSLLLLFVNGAAVHSVLKSTVLKLTWKAMDKTTLHLSWHSVIHKTPIKIVVKKRYYQALKQLTHLPLWKGASARTASFTTEMPNTQKHLTLNSYSSRAQQKQIQSDLI